MLRVSRVDEWLRRAPTRPDLTTHGDCVLIRSAQDGEPGIGLCITDLSAGAQALCLQLVMIPPGSRGMPHFHPGHETALYTVSGQAEVWHGRGLVKRTVVRAGDFMYIPPGTPHLPVNRGDITAIAVVARTGPADGSVVVELPRHLASLLSLPVAVQD
ncbi:MAG TPA: cupin domain-containing protein [Trebonia sp.]|jgi:uncharacterized RmlC-like cupin family protein